jgi:gamma-glutamyltranspeptidase/glutathione hydrolase
LLRTPCHELYAQIDFRETAPAASNMYMYVNSSDPLASTIGGLAVGVPGELRGWELLHKRHGKLPWAKLFDGAIKLARDGFAVPVDLAHLLSAGVLTNLLSR